MVPQNPKRILFVGDSLTYFNNGIDERVQALAAAAGLADVRCESVVKGGAPLTKLWRKTKAKQAIAGGVGWVTKVQPIKPWDTIVVQEDLPETDIETFHKFAAKFLGAAQSAGSSAVLLAMHPYERLGWVDTEGIAKAHEEAAAAAGGDVRVAHSGRAWVTAKAELPDLELFADDREHPSPAGTALAAAVVFTTIWGREAPLLPVPPRLPLLKSSVSPEQLAALHRIAHRTMHTTNL